MTIKPLFTKDFEDNGGLSVPALDTWNWLLSGSGWNLDAGKVEGHFATRQGGHRCLWSCQWSTSRGVLDPNQYLPLEGLSDYALMCEASDVILRGYDYRGYELSKYTLQYYEGNPYNAGYWREKVIELLGESRVGYPDYTWTPSPAGEVQVGNQMFRTRVVDLFRPGWPQEVLVNG